MIQTRHYDGSQENGFLSLYRACLEHYQIPAATSAQETRVTDLLSSGQHLSCLMAYESARPVGFASWSLTFPAGAGLALYMKELFVLQSARGLGVGRALISGLITIAENEGCLRMDWQTDSGNANSQAFYDSINAPTFDKLTFRVNAAEFSSFRSFIS